MGERYPRLEINLAHLKHNVVKVVEKCGDMGIQIAGVIKGFMALQQPLSAATDQGVIIVFATACAAVLLFVGMFAGGQFGSWLLSRLPELVLRWVFVVFLIFVTANQVIFTPSRDQQISMSVGTGIGLVLLGVVIGTLAGLLGIGGGALAVPALSILFGASDLIARGTSLLAMFPNSITTSVANMKRKLVHIKAGLIIGVIAALTTPFGTWVAGAVSPRLAVQSTNTELKIFIPTISSRRV